MITDVDATCEVDTAGAGLELSVPGLVNPTNFRACAIALKHGRDLPPVEEGTGAGMYVGSVATHALAHQGGAAAAGATAQGYAPVPQGMEREQAEAQTQLLRSIDSKLGELLKMASLMNKTPSV